MTPSSFWPFYERIIRQAAGLGRAPSEPDLDRYECINTHCDILIIGGGPSGLSAALKAGQSGARVILADEQNEFGGALLGSDEEIDGSPALDWVAHKVGQLEEMGEVRLIPRTTVFGYYNHNFLTAVERVTDHLGASGGNLPRQRLWRIRAQQVVLATGAIERPMIFENNDRPGVMLASAVGAYVKRYGVCFAKHAVVFTNNDNAYRTALILRNIGVQVSLVDVRPKFNGDWPQRARAAGVEILFNSAVTATRGRRKVKGVNISAFSIDGKLGETRRLSCDLLAVSGGWNPTVHLYSQSGGKLTIDEHNMCLIPDTAGQAVNVIGAAKGTFDLERCLDEGAIIGARVTKNLKILGNLSVRSKTKTVLENEQPLQPKWLIPSPNHPEGGPRHFVDYQTDVTVADIALAVSEGYHSVEHLKRYTTLGLGTDQGKTANINGISILSSIRGEALPSVGHTTFRPPYTPVAFGTLAGRQVGKFLDPLRRTPIHHWHTRAGAVFENVGQWKRPWYYPVLDEDMNDAVVRECRSARQSVGILDASTLGKIEIKGSDAAEFLNLVYTNSWDNMEIGRCRYGLMLGEDGMVMDDGVTSRMA